MSKVLSGFVLLLFTGSAMAADAVYEGTWVTTNRRLDGTMTCVVRDLGDQQWKGRFYGVWQGVEFSYVVKWAGPPDRLVGTARIDGADYTWSGKMTRSTFDGTFDGTRYRGYFKLKRQQ